MQTIDFYFYIQKCLSGNLEDYTNGDIPFISNTTLNNGVVKYVGIINEKEVIDKVPCIAVNGFGFASIQTKPFIGSGNGGVYITALVPKERMDMIELAYYAGQINLQSWRFSYGRRAVRHRLIKLELQKFLTNKIKNNLLTNLKDDIVLKIDGFINKLIDN
ncbi:MAG: hypothetical protein LN561_02775 [Rickettsia endosymbiont of Labidopullus appendiculatus]|nr:hypothetical protein [Rickettsia endosymbiont of Labidopullus appendiculatus]